MPSAEFVSTPVPALMTVRSGVMTALPAGKGDLINRIAASCQRKMGVVGRCGLAAPILSEKIYRQAAKVAKERREEEVIGQWSSGKKMKLPLL